MRAVDASSVSTFFSISQGSLPQESDYLATFEANCISAPKINLTDWTGVQQG